MKFIQNVFAIAIIVLLNYSCDSDLEQYPSSIPVPETPPITKTIFQSLDTTSLLYQAVLKAGLKDTLNTNSGEKLTFLAPTDNAIDSLIKTLGYGHIKYADSLVLRRKLREGIIKGDYNSEALIKTGTGYVKNHYLDVFFNALSKDVVFNKTSKVTQLDVKTTNGTIHYINNCLNMLYVMDIIELDPDFSSFAYAVNRSEQTKAKLGEAKQGAITAFTPNNEAFNILFKKDDIDVKNISELPDVFLDNMIKTSIIEGKVSSQLTFDKITDNQKLINLNKDTLTTVVQSNTKSITYNTLSSDIIPKYDIQAYNGIIHTVNTVLYKGKPE